MENYFIFDIETCPLNLENYQSLDEEERKKLLNPIDSKIIAIGVRSNSGNKIFIGDDEKKILEDFWGEWRRMKQDSVAIGFNVLNFDIPFIVSRSFINNVEIVPFQLKSIIDLRDRINAFRYGKTRGKLTDYGKLLGLEISRTDGSQVADLWRENKVDELKQYLSKDLEITDQLFIRAKQTKIIHIAKW